MIRPTEVSRTRWLRAMGLFILPMVLGFLLTAVAFFKRSAEYSHEVRQIDDLVRSLEKRRPAHISEEVWESAIGWTITAHCNVFFDPMRGDRKALITYHKHLEERLAGEVDVGIFEWMWGELAVTGRHGRQYTEQFGLCLREALGQNAVVPKAGN